MATVDSSTSASYAPSVSYTQETLPPTILQQEPPDASYAGGYVGYFAPSAPGDTDDYRPARAPTPPPSARRGGLLGDSPPAPKKPRPEPRPPEPKPSVKDIRNMIFTAAKWPSLLSIFSLGKKMRVVGEPKGAKRSVERLRAAPAPAPKPRSKADTINHLAKNLSDIDRQIAELKSKMMTDKTDSEEEAQAGPSTLTESSKPSSSGEGAKIVKPLPYTPTPIDDLERQRRKEAKRKRKEAQSRPPPPEEKAVKAEVAVEAKEEAKKLDLVDLFGAPTEEPEEVDEEYDPCDIQNNSRPIPAYLPQPTVRKVPKVPPRRKSAVVPKPEEPKEPSPSPSQVVAPDTPQHPEPSPAPPEEATSSETPPEKPPKKKKKVPQRPPVPPFMKWIEKRKSPEQETKPEMETRDALELHPLGTGRKAHAPNHALNSENLRNKAHAVARGSMRGPRETMAMRYQELQRAKDEMLRRAAAARNGTPLDPTPSSAPPKEPPPHASHREGAVMATVPKGETRVAHAPKPVSASATPTVSPASVGKIPVSVRNRYLAKFVDEAAKFADSQAEANRIAIAEEEAVHAKTTTKGGYLSAAVQAIRKLRESALSGTKPTSSACSISHRNNLTSSKTANNVTLLRNSHANVSIDLTQGSYFYCALRRYVLSDEEMDANGYPLPAMDGDPPDVPSFHRSTNPSGRLPFVPDTDLGRVCCRCGTHYRLTEAGIYVVEEDCVYHWGRPWMGKNSGQWERRYSCCRGEIGSPGCTIALRHISDTLRACDVGGYVATAPLPSHTPLDDPRRTGVYSVDCEMVYTVWGVRLARVTMVDASLRPVLDAIVLPDAQIVDCNSRFSGLTPAHFQGVTTTLADVQRRMQSLVSAETILMGHSLESDLRALKLAHTRCVDTALVFPHRKGPPLKRALRTLMAEILQKIIQDQDEGHDSKEDAEACMRLMQWKVREDAKTKASKSDPFSA